MWISIHCLGQSQCDPSWEHLVGDGVCHDIVNTPECNYDGNDCCTGNSHDWFLGPIPEPEPIPFPFPIAINIATEPASGPQNKLSLALPWPSIPSYNFGCFDCVCHEECEMSLMGNGICDEVNNNYKCNSDG